MPQFDTFSFLSQLFWVFFAFLFFYLLICFYLLPAIAAILKTRKRKLAQISTNSDSSIVLASDFSNNANASLLDITKKLSFLSESSQLMTSTSIDKKLNVFSLKSESFHDFNVLFFTRAQIAYILYA